MRKFLAIILGILSITAFSQGEDILGRDNNPITVAVPFVSIAPDSRASALGDAGVASSPDVYSIHWNIGKLGFIENDQGLSFSYSPWLGNIIDDMSLNYITYYRKLNNQETLGASLRYFDLGEFQLTTESAEAISTENPRELAIDGGYSRKLTENLGVGIAGRFIWSNLTGQYTGASGARNGTSVAVDFGVYYKRPFILSGRNSEMSFGINLSNIGQKISYSDENNEFFIPGNMRLGTAFKTNLDAFNCITLMIDINKFLVPTPPQIDEQRQIIRGKNPDRSLLSGTFGSFGDAPRGFEEELEELTYSFGLEYWYKDVFAARFGHFNEHRNKGNRKYLTAGVGFRYQVFGVDFSYLIPQIQNHPLGDTLRISLMFNLDEVSSDIQEDN